MFSFEVITILARAKQETESIAEHTGRPLLSIGSGDIFHPFSLEQRLSELLALATRWNAVALLDEADVFLQARDLDSVVRNGLVSSRFEHTPSLSTTTQARILTPTLQLYYESWSTLKGSYFSRRTASRQLTTPYNLEYT